MKLLLLSVFLIISFNSLRSQPIEEIKLKAQIRFNNKDFLSVNNLMDQAIQLNPNDGECFYYRGISKIFMGDQEGGCSDVNEAKRLGVKLTNKKYFGFLCDPDYKLKFLKEFFYSHDVLIPQLGYRPAYTRKDSLRGSLRPERTCYDVSYYQLDVKLDPKRHYIEGSNRIYFRVMNSFKRLQLDLFDTYTIYEILWNGKPLTFSREFNTVFVEFPEFLPINSRQDIVVKYSGNPGKAEDPPWKGGFVWKKDKKGNRWDGVACEHLGASSWWPCKDHMTDEPDSMQMTFIAPSGYQVIANGTLKNERKIDNKLTAHTWFVHNPINAYDVTFYMGKFFHFADSVRNDETTFPLDFYVLPFNKDKAAVTFRQNKEVIDIYQQLFGNYPFPEDGFGMIESPYEGMEHQGAIAYGNNFDKHNNTYLHPEYDYIIVHEDAHEWWGNSVSAADMADMWIQEGFATFAEMLFMEKKFGYEDYLKEITNKMTEIFNFWPLVQNRGVNENTFASNDVYTKGAVMLHCLRCTINNDSLFFNLIRDFAIQFKKQEVISDDFIGMVNKYTGCDYAPFFDKFLKETGLPVLEYSWVKNNGKMELKYKWTEVKPGFQMPLCIRAGEKSYRLNGSTETQSIILDTDSFSFYNMWSGVEGIEKNAYTYFWTRKI